VDFVLEGELIIRSAQGEVSARAGEGLLIPKGSDIHFVARDKARFLYVTYPADWQKA
jgi:ethanolamine utilization protein EutQ